MGGGVALDGIGCVLSLSAACMVEGQGLSVFNRQSAFQGCWNVNIGVVTCVCVGVLKLVC